MDKKRLTIAGFSMGAYVLACSNVRPYKTIYASMSPLFPKYINRWPKQWKKALGERRFKDLGTYIQKPNTTFIVGELEPDFFHDVAKHFSNDVVVVKDTGHDLFSTNYLNALQILLDKK